MNNIVLVLFYIDADSWNSHRQFVDVFKDENAIYDYLAKKHSDDNIRHKSWIFHYYKWEEREVLGQ